MEVSISKKDNGLDAQLTVHISAADYQQELDTNISNYRKKMQVPGFRPGKAPMGMVKKMIERDAKREVIDRILQQAVQDYIKENNLRMVLSPLSTYNVEDIDWKNNDFDFGFDIGLRPEINLDMTELNKLIQYKVEAGDEDISEEIDNLRKRSARFEDVDELAPDADLNIVVHFHELDEEGKELEGGAHKIKRYAYNEVPEKLMDVLKGQAKGFKTTVNITEVLSPDELAETLGLEPVAVNDLNPQFEVELQSIYRMHVPELNEEFFDRLFEPGTVTNEDDFRDKIREGMNAYFDQESKNVLATEVKTALTEGTDIKLPDEFVDKYILLSYEAKSPEDIEEYDKKREAFYRDLKWMMISDDIAEKQGFEITEDDIVDYTMAMIGQEFAQMGYPDLGEDFMRKYALDYLKKDNNFTRTSLALRDGKVFEYLISQIEPQVEAIERKRFEEIRNKR